MRTPPPTRVGEVVDTLHGVDVPDPYRWLEDGDDPDVQRWVEDQNRSTRKALDARPDRGEWHERLCALMGRPVVQAVQISGERLVTLERFAGDQQAKLIARPITGPDSIFAGTGGPDRGGPDLGGPDAGVAASSVVGSSGSSLVLVDPADDADDAAAAVDWFYPSDDGRYVAYGMSEGGTEMSVLRLRRLDDGALLADTIPGTRACSIAWLPDSSGFYYTRYADDDPYNRTVYFHQLGDESGDDPVVWNDLPNPQAWAQVQISPHGRYLVVTVMVGWGRHDLHVLDRHDDTWTTLLSEIDATVALAFVTDDVMVGATTLDAPHGRVVRIDLADDPTLAAEWLTLIPERSAVVSSPRATSDGFLLIASDRGVDTIERWDVEGTVVRQVEIPPLSTVAELSTDPRSGLELGLVMGFGSPPAIWRLDADASGDGLPRLVHPSVDTDVPQLAVAHIEYPSTDGTMIGLFLIHRQDLTPDESTPTILNGYGGFAISESPVWSPTIAAWCEAGGQYAIAGLRGGFEHGQAWHEGGRRGQKQNVFDDFQCAADHLVDSGRTCRNKLAIAGGSNGGLLVGAALTQRPDLCRAVWCAVPLLDMVRFPRFLIAKLWTDEYGDPDVAEEFAWLYAYSPYHHVIAGQRYPAVLLTTAAGDSRVDPLHARKMAAALQAAAVDQGARPVLLHQEARAGHGVGKPVSKRADEQADVLSFFAWQLGAPDTSGLG